MAESLPAITLTDPNNRDAAPSPAFSPLRDSSRADFNGAAKGVPRRPVTPTGRSSTARSDSWTSPIRLRRSMSNNPDSREGANGDQEANQVSSPTIDPLSQHILDRTGIPPPSTRPMSAESTSKKDDRPSIDQSAAPAVQPISRTDSLDSIQAQKDLRKGVKAVSFISRLMGNKKKEDETGGDDDEKSDESRAEGNNAQVFSQPVDNIGFSPRQPQPPAYIKMRSKYKKQRDFDRVFLAQELDCRKRPQTERNNSSNKLRRKGSAPSDANAVWAMEFSRDGKYLAAAGVDGIVRVWAVLSSSDDRHKHETQESRESEANGADPHAGHLSAPVFQRQPIRVYEGHESTVLDLSWSKNNFLLSSSMDKTVRLWHVSRSECLCTFKHSDFVPSIAFHPKDDRFFLAGSLDAKLRLWSIPDKSVAYTAQVPDMITAVAFTPDGKCVMAGCLNGLCTFYETEGMRYQTQVHVRSTRGQNAKGSKITGIQAYYDSRSDIKLLITSNDSRVRLYNFRDKNLELKFRGNANNYSQIRATINDDGRHVVCGSEDGKAYIWSMGPCENEKREKRPMEMFEASDSITTVVCLAPAKTRLLLGKSEDPVYDLCNPPPITLLSRSEREESQGSSRPPTENGSIQATPAEAEGRFERTRESASYIARSTHKEGNIIVTADYTGRIKVFRQDCAWTKRRADEWDRSSLFSKRNVRLSRTGSTMSKASQPSLREGRTSTSLSGPSDRIMSWRQGIMSSQSLDKARRQSSKTTSRSISPSQSLNQKSNGQKSAEQTPRIDTSVWKGVPSNIRSANSMSTDALIDPKQAREAAFGTTRASRSGSDSPRSSKEINPLMIQDGRSYLFWDTVEWKARAQRLQKAHAESKQLPQDDGANADDPTHLGVRPPLDRGNTAVSELSDEKESEQSEEYSDAQEDAGVDMQCKHCGGRSFSARQVASGTCLVCARCGERA